MSSRSARYAAALDAISAAAQREFGELMGRLDPDKPVECKYALLEAVPALVEKYGNLAALAAAEFYEGERKDTVGGTYRAQLAGPVERGAVQAKVRYAMRYLFGEQDDETR